MKQGLNHKSSDGIKRRKKVKKTRPQTRSFVVPITEIGTSLHQTGIIIKKNTKKIIGEGIKINKKKKQSSVLENHGQPDEYTIDSEIPSHTGSQKKYNPRYHFFIVSFIKKNKKNIVHILRVVGVMCLFIIVLSQNSKAYITIDPHIEYQTIDQRIQIQKNPKENNLGFDIIAITDTESTTIIANEKRPVERRAQGEITIFNNFSTEPQRILPETRFESASGKVYQLGNEELFVPGKTPDGPGSIRSILFAQNPGEQYNIDSTDFTIPGFKEVGLDAKYNGMYAVSTSSFDGGFVGDEVFISEQQKQNTIEELQKKLREKLLLKLSNERTEQVLLVNDSVTIEYKELDIANTDINQSYISQSGTILGLVISKSMLVEYLTENYIEIPEGEDAQVINIHNLDMSLISSLDNFDYTRSNDAEIVVVGNILMRWNIDKDILAFDIAGTHKKDLLNFFASRNSIDRATTKIRPFWRSILPKKEVSIKITETELDQGK